MSRNGINSQEQRKQKRISSCQEQEAAGMAEWESWTPPSANGGASQFSQGRAQSAWPSFPILDFVDWNCCNCSRLEGVRYRIVKECQVGSCKPWRVLSNRGAWLPRGHFTASGKVQTLTSGRLQCNSRILHHPQQSIVENNKCNFCGSAGRMEKQGSLKHDTKQSRPQEWQRTTKEPTTKYTTLGHRKWHLRNEKKAFHWKNQPKEWSSLPRTQNKSQRNENRRKGVGKMALWFNNSSCSSRGPKRSSQHPQQEVHNQL